MGCACCKDDSSNERSSVWDPLLQEIPDEDKDAESDTMLVN